MAKRYLHKLVETAPRKLKCRVCHREFDQNFDDPLQTHEECSVRLRYAFDSLSKEADRYEEIIKSKEMLEAHLEDVRQLNISLKEQIEEFVSQKCIDHDSVDRTIAAYRQRADFEAKWVRDCRNSLQRSEEKATRARTILLKIAKSLREADKTDIIVEMEEFAEAEAQKFLTETTLDFKQYENMHQRLLQATEEAEKEL